MELVKDASETYAVWMAAIDKRVVSWPLMANPWPTLAICLTYCIAAFALPRILKGQVGITDIYRVTRVSQWANVFFFSALLHRPCKAAGYAVPTATAALCGLLHCVACCTVWPV